MRRPKTACGLTASVGVASLRTVERGPTGSIVAEVLLGHSTRLLPILEKSGVGPSFLPVKSGASHSCPKRRTDTGLRPKRRTDTGLRATPRRGLRKGRIVSANLSESSGTAVSPSQRAPSRPSSGPSTSHGNSPPGSDNCWDPDHRRAEIGHRSALAPCGSLSPPLLSRGRGRRKPHTPNLRHVVQKYRIL